PTQAQEGQPGSAETSATQTAGEEPATGGLDVKSSQPSASVAAPGRTSRTLVPRVAAARERSADLMRAASPAEHVAAPSVPRQHGNRAQAAAPVPVRAPDDRSPATRHPSPQL